MYYCEGYGKVMLWEDDDGHIVLRRVEDVFLLEHFEVDTTIRPVIDSPNSIETKVWKFDSHWTKSKLDSIMVDMLY